MDDVFWIGVVRAMGVLHFVTVGLAHFTPIPAGWDENLAKLPDVHRRFALAQNAFIGAVMIFAGIVSVAFAPGLVSGSTEARIICAGIALWWGARVFVLFWLNVASELGTPLLRFGFILLRLECVAVGLTYGWLAFRCM